MMRVDQDWTNVWPTAATFKPSVVPLPIRQGMVEVERFYFQRQTCSIVHSQYCCWYKLWYREHFQDMRSISLCKFLKWIVILKNIHQNWWQKENGEGNWQAKSGNMHCETSARLRFLVYGDQMSSFTTLQMLTGTCVCCCCFRILQRMTVSHLTSIKIWSWWKFQTFYI